MAVDNYGFITLPDFSEFQPTFSQLVTDVVQTLTTTFPGLIHSRLCIRQPYRRYGH